MKIHGIFDQTQKEERRLRKLFGKSELPPEARSEVKRSLESLSRGLMKLKNRIDRLAGNTEPDLKEIEVRIKPIASTKKDALFQLDPKLRYTWISGDRIFGMPARNLLGKTDNDLFPYDQAERLTGLEREALETGRKTRTEARVVLRGEEHWFDVLYEPWQESSGKTAGLAGYAREITDLKRAEQKLDEIEKKFQDLSMRDGLTGLFNLKYFYDNLKTEIERVNRYHFPLSVLMLDIDNFRSVNERFGRLEGDHVLTRMAEIIRRYIRQVDSAYRYGSEEFTVMLPETESEEAIQVAERIRLGFKAENFSPKIDGKFHLTVSIGVARYFPKEELFAFLKRLDDSLFAAKSQGKDRVHYQEKGGESSFLM